MFADRPRLEVGTLVEVGPAYVGGGKYAADGFGGLHTVVGYLDRGDYYLARGDLRHDPRHSLWDVIVNEARLRRVGVNRGR